MPKPAPKKATPKKLAATPQKMARARGIAGRPPLKEKTPFQTASPNAPFKSVTQPAKPSGAVGYGPFAVTGEAAQRLKAQDWAAYPGGPLPFVDQLEGDSVVTPQRLWYYKLTRFNPIRQLKPETLSHWLDLFQQGYVRYFALLADAIENRDGMLKTVIPKRKAAIKKLKWEIAVEQDLTAAEQKLADQQKEALYQFYNNAQCTDAVDLNQRGGMPMLLDHAMNCIGHKYATFELIYRITPEGDLTATFNFVPLWFFENRTGKLRFLLMDYSIDGAPLKEGSFVTFCGDFLMEPCSVAYMFKHLALRDALVYCEKVSQPGVLGSTDSPYGSANYNALVDAVRAIGTDFSAVSGKGDKIEGINFGTSNGHEAHHVLVDYMDRAMTAMWRGADLSTMSARGVGSGGMGNAGQGASLQGKEEYNIQCTDAQNLNEVFKINVDRLVLDWRFGKGVKQLAYFKIVVPPNIEAATDIQIVNALLQWGVEEIGVKQALEHFGWQPMMGNDTPLMTPIQSQQLQTDMQTDAHLQQAESLAGNENQLQRITRLVNEANLIKAARRQRNGA